MAEQDSHSKEEVSKTNIAYQQDLFERDIILDDLKRTLQFASTDKQKFISRTNDLGEKQRKFNRIQSKIEKHLMQTNLFNKEEQMKYRNDFDDSYYAIITHSQKIKDSDYETRRASRVGFRAEGNISMPKLQKLPLPMYSGDRTDWSSYFDLFNSLVHNNDAYTNAEKFRYLLLTLKGEPHNLVKSLPVTDANYLVALQILVSRYENKRIIASTHLDNILDIPPCNEKITNSLRILLNTYQENIQALEVLNLPTGEWSFILLTILLRKIPANIRKRYELTLMSPSDIPSIDTLITFLERELSACEISNIKSGQSNNKNCFINEGQYHAVVNGGNTSMQPHKRAFAVNFNPNYENKMSFNNRPSASSIKFHKCLCCNAQHTLTKCSQFLNFSPQDRYNFIQNKNVCYNCLHVGHSVNQCRSNYVCRSCHKRHHSLIHFYNNNENSEMPTHDRTVRSSNISVSHVHTGKQSIDRADCRDDGAPTQAHVLAMTSVDRPRTALRGRAPDGKRGSVVLLSTAAIDVCVNDKTRVSVRCLIDTGSQASFITEDCVRRLGLTRRKINSSPVFGINENKPIYPKGLTSFLVTPKNKCEPSIQVDALILSKLITTSVPTCRLPYEQWSHIQNLNLADPHFYIPQPVEMLLGADIFPHILLQNIIRGPPGSPMAINSIFGYLLLGKVDVNLSSVLVSNPIQVNHCSVNNFDLQRFWELESIPEQKTLTRDELLCEQNFVDTHVRDDTGRYVLRLPFKPDAPPLDASRDIAIARFRKLEYRLERNSQLKQSYHACLQDYLDQNHMEPVTSQAIASQSYYIPHHAVVKQSSDTTPTRVVFDASSKTANGISLNDVLLTGPKLHLDIVEVLLKFRTHSIAFTADIRQMYRNILISEADRDFQRIVWRSSPDEPIRDYRIRTVCFGVSSSPYLALRTMRQLAHDEASLFPRASQVLMSDVFVDDVVSGADTESEALSLQQELLGICQAAGFELRKWYSNSPKLSTTTQPVSSHGERHIQVPFADMENDTNVKVLGLQWSPYSDTFSFSVKVSSGTCSKRSILSEVARVYDPLGFLSPVIVFAKHLIQLLWIARVAWDETPPRDIINSWSSFTSELPLLSKLTFPRHVFPFAGKIQLHGFADASERAYAACIYLRIENNTGDVNISLLLAKTRVAPTKRISIPRLELMAALLLARLFQKILPTYGERINFDQLFAWSDSCIVLSWLRSSPHEWKTFVSNRVTEILNIVPASCWRHVPSADNPADAASRGMLPATFIKNYLWFLGPHWLREEQSSWPVLKVISPTEEEKRSVAIVCNPCAISTSDDGELVSRFSSLGKLVRVTALIFRFYNKCKKSKTSCPAHITVSEYNFSLNRLIYLVQHFFFTDDIVNISNGKQPSNQLRRLNPFLDSDNFLRVGGRIHKSLLPYESKHQLILPKKHPLTLLIISDVHITQLHAGPQSTQYALLQRYWILSSRDIVRQCIHRCVSCARARPASLQPRMAPLPSVRIRQPERLFTNVSCDFCGPFYVRANKVRNAKVVKCYVCVFVCMSVKAVHLELVSELSTEAFLATLRRFTSRRGLCTNIYSDCGRNFIGCDRYLKELFEYLRTDTVQATLNAKLLKQGITWHFQPPYASHFGGLFEAGVKSFKHHFQRVVGTRVLTYDEMHTLLCQIEAVLNSRPLCVLSADAMDPLPLTPAHFLIGGPMHAIPDVSLEDTPSSRLVRWRLIQQSTQHFWRRWSLEYLHEIQQQSKWYKDQGASIREGSIVVVRDDNLPPLQWRLARVHALHPGPDGITRVVTLQAGNTFFKRAVVKVCPLPVE